MRRSAIVAIVLAATVGCKKRREEAVPAITPVAPVKPEPATPEPATPEPAKPEAPEPQVHFPTQPDPWLDAPRRADPPPSDPQRPSDRPLAFDIDKLQAPRATSPPTFEALVQEVRAVGMHAPELVIVKVVGSYVTKTGQLAPEYGKLDVDLELLDGVDGVIDDPNRPTGAPIKERKPVEKTRDECPRLTFENENWSLAEAPCRKVRVKGGPSCTASQIWTKAIAHGAPENAVAIVQFDARTALWMFRITDKIRNVNFNRSYRDDCAATKQGVEAP